MTLDEAYRHIKASYIHHSQERNAVFLPQAELIAMECIEKCKQADVQPVRRGRWIITDDVEHFIAVCSECGRTEDSRCIKDMPYCHCGARMDGGING